uniref:Chemokine interleukin-8-like domain-containing protein n=1 Tax=Electrophorus electricus TaxID=8005 RepID=A0AAY5EBB9_ELEEL
MKISNIKFQHLKHKLKDRFSSSAHAPGTPQTCCFDFFKGKIPVNKIKKIEKLDSRCANPGFL